MKMMSPFVLWADGEAGDHAYSGLTRLPTEVTTKVLEDIAKMPQKQITVVFRGHT